MARRRVSAEQKNIRAQKRLREYIENPSSMKRMPYARGNFYTAETRLLLETAKAVFSRNNDRVYDESRLRRARASTKRRIAHSEAERSRIESIIGLANAKGFLEEKVEIIRELSLEHNVQFIDIKNDGLTQHWKYKRYIDEYLSFELSIRDVVESSLNPVLHKILRSEVRLPAIVDTRRMVRSSLSGRLPSEIGKELDAEIVKIKTTINENPEDERAIRYKLDRFKMFLDRENREFERAFQDTEDRLMKIIERLRVGARRLHTEANALGRMGGSKNVNRASNLRKLADSMIATRYEDSLREIREIVDNEVEKEFRRIRDEELGVAERRAASMGIMSLFEERKFSTIGDIRVGRFYQMSYTPRWRGEYDASPFIFVVDNDYPLHRGPIRNKKNSRGVLAYNFNHLPPALAIDLLSEIVQINENMDNILNDRDLNVQGLENTKVSALRRTSIRQYHYEWAEIVTDFRPDTGYAAIRGYTNIPFDMVFRKISNREIKRDSQYRQ